MTLKGILPTSSWASLITLPLGFLCVHSDGGQTHSGPFLLDHGPLPTFHGQLPLAGPSQDEHLTPHPCPHQAVLLRLFIDSSVSGKIPGGPTPGPLLAAETNQLPYCQGLPWTLPEEIYTQLECRGEGACLGVGWVAGSL